MSGRADTTFSIYRLKIKLLRVSKPPIWRRVLVPAEIRLDRLHRVIQVAMGWQDCHMHVFTTGAAEFGRPDPELGHHDERRVTLSQLLASAGDRIRYTYDFGDDWEHEIVLEAVLVGNPGERYPRCTAGKSACPPEDCGGAWGYADLREALADPGHEQHTELLEWLELEDGSDFDPADFDVEQADAALAYLGTVAA